MVRTDVEAGVGGRVVAVGCRVVRSVSGALRPALHRRYPSVGVSVGGREQVVLLNDAHGYKTAAWVAARVVVARVVAVAKGRRVEAVALGVGARSDAGEIARARFARFAHGLYPALTSVAVGLCVEVVAKTLDIRPAKRRVDTPATWRASAYSVGLLL